MPWMKVGHDSMIHKPQGTPRHPHTAPSRCSPTSPARPRVVGVHTTLTNDGQPHTPHRPCAVPRAVPKKPPPQPKPPVAHTQAPPHRPTPLRHGLTRSATCGRGAHHLNAGRAAPHTSSSVRRTSCRAAKRALYAQKPLFTRPGTFILYAIFSNSMFGPG